MSFETFHRRFLPLERLCGGVIVSVGMVLAVGRRLWLSESMVYARGDHRLKGLKVMYQIQTLKEKWASGPQHCAPPQFRPVVPVMASGTPHSDIVWRTSETGTGSRTR